MAMSRSCTASRPVVILWVIVHTALPLWAPVEDPKGIALLFWAHDGCVGKIQGTALRLEGADIHDVDDDLGDAGDIKG